MPSFQGYSFRTTPRIGLKSRHFQLKVSLNRSARSRLRLLCVGVSIRITSSVGGFTTRWRGRRRNHWDALNLYATDGRIPIDNNRVEQLMREVALGRKNWLFVGNVEAGERAARLMTLVSSAKRHQLDVRMYLKDVLDRLLEGETDYEKFSPDAWKAAHPEAVRTYREEETRYKVDRKKVSRAKRIIAAKQKRERAETQSG
ncbi:MAG: IS66 family transposase [Planctomycetes bacterium]|nr:IS66 family transposase [Planctomycetota bacterium]